MPELRPAVVERLSVLAAQPLNDAWLNRDPLRFPKRFHRQEDVEVVAVLSAQLAYGRVELFGAVIEKILGLMGDSPGDYVKNFGAKEEEALRPILYRWNRHPDFALLFRTLQAVYQEFPSLGAIFVGEDYLQAGVEGLRKRVPLPKDQCPASFLRFLPLPSDGSACKRWRMLLRWMVRREAPDLGLWTHLSPASLILPLDTHTSRISRFLGLTLRNDASGRTASEITAALATICPEDPVRYDFALAHLGISEGCKGYRDPDTCGSCPLNSVCGAPPRAG